MRSRGLGGFVDLDQNSPAPLERNDGGIWFLVEINFASSPSEIFVLVHHSLPAGM